MKKIRVALVDDHPVVLAGIAALLRRAPEIEVVGEATTGAEGISLARNAAPDLIVIDLSLPDMNGVDLAKEIASVNPGARLLALTVHEDRAYVQRLLQAGARGYVLKRSAAADLLRAIRAVVEEGSTSIRRWRRRLFLPLMILPLAERTHASSARGKKQF
jgi:DNA-binding NarL/FixJ family response regulator